MRTRGPCLGMFLLGARATLVGTLSCSWNNQDFSDEETFARLAHESSDGSNEFAVDTLLTMVGSLSVIHNSYGGYTQRRNHLGNRIQIQIHHAFRRYVIQRSDELGTNMPVCSTALSPNELPYRAQTMKSSPSTTKTSRQYKTVCYVEIN